MGMICGHDGDDMSDDDPCPLLAETGNPCCMQREHQCACADELTTRERIEEFIAMMQRCGIKPIVIDQLPDGSLSNARTVDPAANADELREALGVTVSR